MSQPLTLTLARKAPRTTQIAGSLLVVCLLILPFFALLPATHPLALSTSDADADWQDPLLCHRGGGAGIWCGDTPVCCPLGTASSSPQAAMRWACT